MEPATDRERLVGLLREAAARGPATEALRAQIREAVQNLGDAGVEVLAASPYLARLTTLDLSSIEIGDVGRGRWPPPPTWLV
jgi:hypothetical protein